MENLKQRAVQAAERFLRCRGYDVVDAGWESPAGGIDIVARDGGALVFVEVAVRDGASGGFPPSRNEGEQRARREGAAIAYLAERGADEGPVRFDDVALVVLAPDRTLVATTSTRSPQPRSRSARKPSRGSPRPPAPP